ncbi:MAG: hypothetical protein ACLURV_06975 [Gallintestinimicrobium sp.]
MRQFLKDFPEAKQIFSVGQLSQPRGIVETAGKLIGQNRERFPKQIVLDRARRMRGRTCALCQKRRRGRAGCREKKPLPIPTGTASGISTAAFDAAGCP